MFLPVHNNFSYVCLQISIFSNEDCRLVVEVSIKDKSLTRIRKSKIEILYHISSFIVQTQNGDG